MDSGNGLWQSIVEGDFQAEREEKGEKEEFENALGPRDPDKDASDGASSRDSFSSYVSIGDIGPISPESVSLSPQSGFPPTPESLSRSIRNKSDSSSASSLSASPEQHSLLGFVRSVIPGIWGGEAKVESPALRGVSSASSARSSAMSSFASISSMSASSGDDRPEGHPAERYAENDDHDGGPEGIPDEDGSPPDDSNARPEGVSPEDGVPAVAHPAEHPKPEALPKLATGSDGLSPDFAAQKHALEQQIKALTSCLHNPNLAHIADDLRAELESALSKLDALNQNSMRETGENPLSKLLNTTTGATSPEAEKEQEQKEQKEGKEAEEERAVPEPSKKTAVKKLESAAAKTPNRLQTLPTQKPPKPRRRRPAVRVPIPGTGSQHSAARMATAPPQQLPQQDANRQQARLLVNPPVHRAVAPAAPPHANPPTPDWAAGIRNLVGKGWRPAVAATFIGKARREWRNTQKIPARVTGTVPLKVR